MTCGLSTNLLGMVKWYLVALRPLKGYVDAKGVDSRSYGTRPVSYNFKGFKPTVSRFSPLIVLVSCTVF